MGCGASVNNAPVEEQEPEDPLQQLLQQIHAEQETLRGKLPELENVKHEQRYLKNTCNKLQKTNQRLKKDLKKAAMMHEDMKLHTADRDAYQLREASKGFGTDESAMAAVIVARSKENLEQMDEIYQRRFGRSIEDQIRGENKTLLGLVTGGLTDFGRFLWYRCVSQPQRDAFLIRKCMSGVGCSDYILMEIMSTRTNQELMDATAAYAEAYEGEDMIERIKSETGGFGKKWYGLWVDTLCDLNRDESSGLSGDPAEMAQRLYDAGAGKWTGTDEQVFIDILCNANEETCAAIAQAYEELESSQRSLREDVEKEMGGDLEFAVLARVLPKDQFLALRIYKACKGWGTDEECIGRVLGCSDKEDAAALEAYYNEAYAEEDEPYNNLRALLTSELSGSFLDSLLLFLESCPPKGHRSPQREYDASAERAGAEFRAQVEGAYDRDAAIEHGQRKGKLPLVLTGIDGVHLREDYAKNMAPKQKKVFEANVNEEKLFGGDPTDVEEATKLLEQLQNKNANVQENIEKTTEKNAEFMAKYINRAENMRSKEHLLRQLQDDNDNMLHFNASRDADIVRVAVAGCGTDEDKLIRTLCCLQKPMVRMVDEVYQERYGQCLREVTDSELGGMFEGDFKYFMKCVLTPDDVLDAELLVQSMKGLGTDDHLLCEIVCTRSNDELHAACAVFEQLEGKSVFEWVEGDTSGGYCKFLLACLKGERDEHEEEADEEEAEEQAKRLHGAGIGEGDIDADVIIEVLAEESECQIEAIKDAYEKAYETPLTDAIQNIGGDWEKALLARVYDKPTYYATTLEKAMKGLGTDDSTVARILGRTPKAELQGVAERYQELYERSLHDAIDSETSGNFKKALLTALFCEKPGEDPDPGLEEGEEEAAEEEE